MAQAIGIDIHDQDIFAAQVQAGRGRTRVRALAHRRLPQRISATGDAEGLDALLVPALSELRRSGRFKGRLGVLSLPAHLMFSFPLKFQVDKGEKVEQAIVRGCQPHLTLPLAMALLDYPSLIRQGGDQDPARYAAIVCGAHRDHVERYLALARAAGWRIDAVDFSVAALARYHVRLHGSGDRVATLCSVGRWQSLLVMLAADGILAQRQVAWGTEAISERLRTNLDMPSGSDMAAFMLRHYGLGYVESQAVDDPAAPETAEQMGIRRAVYQITAPAIDDLLLEFEKMFSYVRAELGNPMFGAIHLYGRAGDILHLDRFIAQRLNMTADIGDPGRYMTGTAEATSGTGPDATCWATALGLALRRVSWL